ncbi:crosslink repair DNA glycosylase YcaQ family protein [Bacillus carboniphilus]|uniref:Crosslink repair DNA glycosylase YcaQ family protein n=1 Tax=Bacillus carboniphilus TaxID=86663 RepID=A0ABY9JWM0_9BACI|nr:crosslink repair DNA glycosylase YcaQ family protein [Bacillus carboniphilus]WLR42076.1 crosslink repair DNA glycosylase YcaQ family protein [Bacillus carboniphilus]
MKKKIIISERLKRQKLLAPLSNSNNAEAYKQLFRLLQPVAPVHNSRPGNPPKLVHRTSFDDTLLAENLRQQHMIVKGRFQGGRIGYVLEEDLSLYASIFKKPIQKVTSLHEEILSILHRSGGMSKDLLKEQLPYKATEINAALKRMQEAFWLYESQIDTDWNTGWFDFKEEWPEVDLSQNSTSDVAKILLRFLEAFVFATLNQMKSWSQLKLKTLNNALDFLIESEQIIKLDIEGIGIGYMRKEDESLSDGDITPSVFMLDKSDFLVRAYLDELNQMFKGKEVLQYLLIDGEFKGAVLGHWRIGPHDVDDVEVILPQEECNERREEIIAEIRKGYSKETTEILHFNGEPLT